MHSELPTPIPGERSSQVGAPWGLGWAESSTSRKSQRLSKVAQVKGKRKREKVAQGKGKNKGASNRDPQVQCISKGGR